MMEEENHELKFVCKLCNKKYPCGKSLGGHMRSHIVAISAESEEKFEKKMGFVVGNGLQSSTNSTKDSKFLENGQSAYGLRENPKKTWRAVDSTLPSPQERICKQCGKGFQSLKALCGHMACHSERDRGLKDDHSWTSENQKLVLDSHSDTEEAGQQRKPRTRSKRYKKFSVMKSPSFCLVNNNNNTCNGSSSVSEIDGGEKEEMALCLMLLSRDSLNKNGVNSVVESSDNNSVVLETKSSSIDMRIGTKLNCGEEEGKKKIGDGKLKGKACLDTEIENSDSGYFLDECAKAESDVSVDGFRRNGFSGGYNGKNFSKVTENEFYDDDEDDDGIGSRIEPRKRKLYISSEVYNNSSQKRSKYECYNCKKVFKSFQALGGHRPCHKKSYESRYGSGENSFDDEKRTKSKEDRKGSKKQVKKGKGHSCPFCDRVFKNGQALGGHKRSHFLTGHVVESSNRQKSPGLKSDLLDLNLPAPEEDEDEGEARFLHW